MPLDGRASPARHIERLGIEGDRPATARLTSAGAGPAADAIENSSTTPGPPPRSAECYPRPPLRVAPWGGYLYPCCLDKTPCCTLPPPPDVRGDQRLPIQTLILGRSIGQLVATPPAVRAVYSLLFLSSRGREKWQDAGAKCHRHRNPASPGENGGSGDAD